MSQRLAPGGIPATANNYCPPNKIAIYGKVVFASYKHDTSRGSNTVQDYYAEKPSPHTNGYLVIAQINDSLYPYYGLTNVYQPFSYYTHYYNDSTFLLNVPKQDPDIPHCIRFVVRFPDDMQNIPILPAAGKYVKIMYDPHAYGIEMYTNDTNTVTPDFDSIPALAK